MMLQREIEEAFNDYSPNLHSCHEVEVVVRYAETDQMGIAYHGHYFTWFHLVRDAIVSRAGIDIKYWEQNAIYSPVVEANCIYKFPALYNDLLLVQGMAGIGRKTRMTMFYRLVRKKDGKVIALGKTVNVLMKKDTGILLEFPEQMKPLLEALFSSARILS